jgi:hypothetical protein
MLPELMGFLPQGASCSLGGVVAGAVGGMALWLAGARFSRSIVTLAAVAIGTSFGLRLPGWLGWEIDGMGIAVGAAVILGISGYLLHRTWIGLGLGILSAVWAAFGAKAAGGAAFDMTINWNGGVWPALQSAWSSLPLPLAREISLAASLAFIAGVTTAIFWPRLSRVLAWSLAGTTLGLMMLAVASRSGQLHWMRAMGLGASAQAAVLVGLVTLGGLIQWQLVPPAEAKNAARPMNVSELDCWNDD